MSLFFFFCYWFFLFFLLFAEHPEAGRSPINFSGNLGNLIRLSEGTGHRDRVAARGGEEELVSCMGMTWKTIRPEDEYAGGESSSL